VGAKQPSTDATVRQQSSTNAPAERSRADLERPHAGLAHHRERYALAPTRLRRVSVVGVTGAGKTTLAAALASALDLVHVELDALHWEPNWVMAEPAVFRERVANALACDAWVADGNYSTVRDELVWDRADTVVWLDYSFPLILGRLVRRTFTRLLTRELLWGNNHERWSNHFLSRDSLFLWAIHSYPKHRRTYPQLLASEQFRHLALVQLRSPAQAKRWLAAVAPSPTRQSR
jgi:adenylate kinase family enzyme